MKKFIKNSLYLLLIFCLFSCTENHYKKYIIKHKSELKRQDKNYIVINNIKNSYYTDITIKVQQDSTLYIILWGNRNSWQWGFRLDNDFRIDIPYQRYKKENIKLDVELFEIVNNIN